MRLRPSMRENFRYILVHIIPDPDYQSREIYRSTAESAISLFGDSIVAQMWPSIMQVSGPYAIIRCRRGLEKKLETAVSAITQIQGIPAAVHPVKTSGSIKTLREIIPNEPEIRKGKAIISGKTYEVKVSCRRRIDLNEKGIYLEIPR